MVAAADGIAMAARVDIEAAGDPQAAVDGVTVTDPPLTAPIVMKWTCPKTASRCR